MEIRRCTDGRQQKGSDGPATNGKAKWYWLAKVVNGGKNLILREGNLNAGFAIIIR